MENRKLRCLAVLLLVLMLAVALPLSRADVFADENSEPAGEPASIEYEVKGFDGSYDGQGHGITVTLKTPGCTVMYGLEKGHCYFESTPKYFNADENTVYFIITKDDGTLDPVEGSAKIRITQRKVTIKPAGSVSKHIGESDPQSLGYVILSGSTTQEDALAVKEIKAADILVSRQAGEAPGTYPISIALKSGAEYPNYNITLDSQSVFTVNDHGWNYTAEGNKITVFCENENCAYHNTDAKLVLTAPEDGVYNGTPYVASFTNTITAVTGAQAGSVQYEKDGSSQAEARNAGSYVAKITIGGKTAKASFTISPLSFADAVIEDIPDQPHSGSAFTPELSVTYDGQPLTANKDYTVSYKDNVEIGVAKVTVTGTGNYSGSQNKSFEIIASAEETLSLINAIGTVEYTPECKTRIDAARRAYNSLKDGQKQLITPEQLKVLTDAEAEYARLEKAAKDKAAAAAAVEKIKAIGKVVYTDACKGRIDAARKAYDRLTPDQKKLVTAEEYKILTDAEAAYKKLQAEHKAETDKAAAKAVEEKIDAIGTVEYTDPCKERIDGARSGYDALTQDQSALITDEKYKVLTDAEAEYARLQAAAGVFEIFEGKNGQWKEEAPKALIFKGNGELADLVCVKVDGKEVDPKYYDKKAGSTVIELKESFIKTLSEGMHTLEMVWKEGAAEAAFTVVKAKAEPAPEKETEKETKGSNNNILWIIIAAVVAFVAGILVGNRRKSKAAETPAKAAKPSGNKNSRK